VPRLPVDLELYRQKQIKVAAVVRGFDADEGGQKLSGLFAPLSVDQPLRL